MPNTEALSPAVRPDKVAKEKIVLGSISYWRIGSSWQSQYLLRCSMSQCTRMFNAHQCYIWARPPDSRQPGAQPGQQGTLIRQVCRQGLGIQSRIAWGCDFSRWFSCCWIRFPLYLVGSIYLRMFKVIDIYQHAVSPKPRSQNRAPPFKPQVNMLCKRHFSWCDLQQEQ